MKRIIYLIIALFFAACYEEDVFTTITGQGVHVIVVSLPRVLLLLKMMMPSM